MNEEDKKQTLYQIEDNLLDFNRGMTGLLKHSEVYLILDLVKRFVEKNEVIKKAEEKKEKDNNIKAEFVMKHKGLSAEWEKYKLTKIKKGCDFSESFFNWLVYIKCIDYKTFKESKE